MQLGQKLNNREFFNILKKLSILKGEQAVREMLDTKATIIRTAGLYSSHGSTFVKSMLSLMDTKPEPNIIHEPTPARRFFCGILDKTALWQALDIKPVHWRRQLRAMLKELK